MTRSKIETAAAYIVAAAILGVWIYFLPLLFIGFVAGLAVGINYQKIKDWIDNTEDPTDGII